MTVTPSRNSRLWHPARGIIFSSAGSASSPSPARTSRSPISLTAGVSQQRYVVTSQSINTQSEDLASVLVQQTPPAIRKARTVSRRLGVRSPAENTAECDSVPVAEEPVPETQPEAEPTVAPKKIPDVPPLKVLDYAMVEPLFRAAKESAPGSTESYWSYSHYRRKEKDGTLRKPTVHYCRSTETMERVCQYFIGEKVLGFDLEWVVDAMKHQGLRKNVSLIQLASSSRIGLFHVALFPQCWDMVGPTFRRLMEDPNVVKVGVAIKGDATRLRNFLDIESQGLMELSNLYRLVTHSRTGQYHMINRRLVPLATQVEEYLHLPLYKGAAVRTSNWSAPLDMDQLKYSASDAYAGLHLYATLEHHRKQLDPCPPRPHYAELGMPILLKDEAIPGRQDDVQEVDATEFEELDDSETKASPTSKRGPRKSSERIKDSRVESAESQAVSYRASHPDSRATVATLRVYYLWHDYNLSPGTIAQLLRDPPLKLSTVANHILAAIKSERLPADSTRLREVAREIHNRLREVEPDLPKENEPKENEPKEYPPMEKSCADDPWAFETLPVSRSSRSSRWNHLYRDAI
ncbi:ribonuclease H-like protein [Xylaria nigripes]|nr:ribonuclease H-like protein [Xylaria nigripes]